MHLVNYLAFQLDTRPALIGPLEFVGRDNLGRPMRTFGLKTRCGIRESVFLAIQGKSVQSSGSSLLDCAGKISISFRFQNKPGAPKIRTENNFNRAPPG